MTELTADGSAVTDLTNAFPETEAPAKPTNIATVTLAEPLERKGGNIIELSIRRPRTGELRGLKVEDLYATDVNALILLLPRITEPKLIAQEVEKICPEDLIEIAGTVKGFFMTAAMKEAVRKHLGG